MTAALQGLTIGAVAERAGCSVPAVRYYEEIGLLPKAARRPGGHRFYSSADLRRLTFIRRCREFGFPIEQVKALVALTDGADRDCIEARDLAQSHLDDVRKKLAELQALERSLVAFVETCNTACAGGPATQCVILDDLGDPDAAACCA